MAKPKEKPNYMYDHSYGLFCPHCTKEQKGNPCSLDISGSVDKMGKKNRTDEQLFTCWECGKRFFYSMQVEITFNSRIPK